MIEIPLTQGKVAIIDNADWDLIIQYTWYAMKSRHKWYARTNLPNDRGMFMHNLLLDTFDGIDHKDRDGLNNRRENLRVCTATQNLANAGKRWDGITSTYKGVWWAKGRQKWHSQTSKGGVRRFIGYFDTADEAALAYNRVALELFGEFANLNIVGGAQLQ